MRSINRRQFVYGTGAVLGSTMFGCGRPDGPTAGADTTVFVNGTVLPVDAAFSGHEALAISGNRILAVGARDEVLAAAGRGAKTVDLAGRVVLPGFIEPHMHFALMAGLGFIEDVGPFRFPTFDDALDALRRIAAAAGPDEWVMGRQFDPILLDSPRDLTTRDLDPITPDRPAFVLNASGHIAYVNSKTLELVGITRDSEDPPGGEYGRYEDGTPNGVMYGQSAYMGILFLNEKITERMQSGFVTAGREVGDEAAALGITTLCDQATGAIAGPAELDTYRAMFDGGQMHSRIRAYAYSEQPGWDEAGVTAGQGDALMRLETMVAMANFEIPSQFLRRYISSAIDVVIHLSRLTDGTRKLISLHEITGMEGDTITTQNIFSFKQLGIKPDGTVRGRFAFEGVRPKFISRFKMVGINVSADLFDPSNQIEV